jgi:hypothetical protein
VLFAEHAINKNDHIKEDEMGMACSPHGKINVYRILVEKLRCKDH